MSSVDCKTATQVTCRASPHELHCAWHVQLLSWLLSAPPSPCIAGNMQQHLKQHNTDSLEAQVQQHTGSLLSRTVGSSSWLAGGSVLRSHKHSDGMGQTSSPSEQTHPRTNISFSNTHSQPRIRSRTGTHTACDDEPPADNMMHTVFAHHTWQMSTATAAAIYATAGTCARCWHAMHNGASTWSIMLVPEASLMHFLSKGVCIVCTHGQTLVWSLVQVHTHVKPYTSSAQCTPLKLHTALLGSAHAESGRHHCSPAARQCPLPGKKHHKRSCRNTREALPAVSCSCLAA